jgi:hypothetical protein
MQFTIFSLVVRSLDVANVQWRSGALTKLLEEQSVGPSRYWHDLIMTAAAVIREQYYEEAKRYKSTSAQSLPLSNFFKSQSYVEKLFQRALSPQLRVHAKAVLKH